MRIDASKVLRPTVRVSFPLIFLPPRRSFIGIWFVIAFKLFDLCTFTVAFLFSTSIPISGSMVSVVGVAAIRV